MKKNLNFFSTVMLTTSLLIGASVLMGSGGKNGGGTPDTGPGTNPGWQTGYISLNWVYAHLAVNTNCGTYFPMAIGYPNTCPSTAAQTIYNNHNMYCNVSVMSQETVADGYPKEMSTCISGTGTSTIQIPYNHKYRILLWFSDRCDNCMSPEIITLSGSDGRRIQWVNNKLFPRYTNYPYADMTFDHLKLCSY